jgi:hypothetical protein
MMIVGALALLATACGNKAETDAPAGVTPDPSPAQPNPEPVPVAVTQKKLFLDVHDLGSGKVTAKDVAAAHEKDLATEGKYGVDYKAYWLDEKEGKIYCLAEAPSAEAANAVHKEAHGLVANSIMEVTSDNTTWRPTAGMKLYLDIHHLGAGKVTAKDVAGAHAKDLAAQSKHDVTYLNYWLDEASGTVLCLSEAPSAEAAIAVHREAHGLIPDSIEEVTEGR